jgi:hypothetical protein
LEREDAGARDKHRKCDETDLDTHDYAGKAVCFVGSKAVLFRGGLDEYAFLEQNISQSYHQDDGTTCQDDVAVLDLVGRKESENTHGGTGACPGTA